MRLVLFDLDGTLIRTPKSKDDVAYPEAFKKVYGIDTNIGIIEHSGMTDQQIIIDVMKKNGLDEPAVRRKLKECTEALINSFNKSIGGEEILLMPGVRELPEELNRNKVLMGLVTGNLEAIARTELKKAGINKYFKIGGFGSDGFKRTDLVRLAIKRAKEEYKMIFDDVFIVGDTPRDIAAGKKVGIKTVGVATGNYTMQQLKNAGADFVFGDLRNTKKILNTILNN